MAEQLLVCKNCGQQKNVTRYHYDVERKFCSRQCFREWQIKEQARKLAEAPPPPTEKKPPGKAITKPRTPEAQCKKCKWGQMIGHVYGCGYFDFDNNHSRHYLHPDGLPDVCQEYEPRKRKRKPKLRPIEVY